MRENLNHSIPLSILAPLHPLTVTCLLLQCVCICIKFLHVRPLGTSDYLSITSAQLITQRVVHSMPVLAGKFEKYESFSFIQILRLFSFHGLETTSEGGETT